FQVDQAVGTDRCFLVFRQTGGNPAKIPTRTTAALKAGTKREQTSIHYPGAGIKIAVVPSDIVLILDDSAGTDVGKCNCRCLCLEPLITHHSAVQRLSRVLGNGTVRLHRAGM